MSTIRTFSPEHTDAGFVARRKRGATISVCIPCRNESATIGPLVDSIVAELMNETQLVDELIVVDDASTDGTASVAARCGARVVDIGDVNAAFGEERGKGNALWASLIASRGDLVVWLDGDVTSCRPSWVAKMVAPLLDHDDLALVKAATQRPTDRGGGGRTTELVARPLLSMYYPRLAVLRQPLGGEYAGRRTALESIPFATGWGVEIAMLIDLVERFGPHAIGQIDVGVREHRHRSLSSLSVQAAEVMATVLSRVGGVADAAPSGLLRPDGQSEALNLGRRPPVASLGPNAHAILASVAGAN